MSLKGVFAEAVRIRRAIIETEPWQRLEYGWRDRLEHANREIIAAMKAHPRRFKVQTDPHDSGTVIVTTPAHRVIKRTGWERSARKNSRQISARLPMKMFEVRGIKGRRGEKVYEDFFLEMLSRNGKGKG